MDFTSLNPTTSKDFLDSSSVNYDDPDFPSDTLKELGSKLNVTPQLVEYLDDLLRKECVNAVINSSALGEQIRGKMKLVQYLRQMLP